ncbi:MAG: hydrogenase 4 subunit F, partial [Candidatus Omnitrophica bacterium]|nr:hydrogenase 4 subunit F [Candidatus Omnitrophota bacterium]
MSILIGLVLGLPLVLSLLSLVVRNERALGVVHAFGYAVMLALFSLFMKGFLISFEPLSLGGWLYLDALSVFFIFTTIVVACAASIYSIGYICEEVAHKQITPRKARGYYRLFNLFCFTMVLAPMLNNLAFLWIAIEMTTLVSAFLVGFHNVKESIEAAWKYIIICSVGITFALLGIILFYYTSFEHAGIKSMEWAGMLSSSHLFDPAVVRIALLFIFVGFGTKAGFAPM